jgi:hypothetical protein
LIELLTQMDGFDQGSTVKVRALSYWAVTECVLRQEFSGYYGHESCRYFGSRLASSRSS